MMAEDHHDDFIIWYGELQESVIEQIINNQDGPIMADRLILILKDTDMSRGVIAQLKLQTRNMVTLQSWDKFFFPAVRTCDTSQNFVLRLN